MHTLTDLQILGHFIWEIDDKCPRPRKSVMLKMTNFVDMEVRTLLNKIEMPGEKLILRLKDVDILESTAYQYSKIAKAQWKLPSLRH